MTEIDFETQIKSIARQMDYPPTPDIAGHVRSRLQPTIKPRFISRRLAWSLITILILFASLFFIPPARAAIIEFIQVGIVQIFKPEPTPSPATIHPISVTTLPSTATPIQTSESLIPLLNRVAGQTTLEKASDQVNFPILLPTYPLDIGEPDLVFIQQADGALLILIWLDPENPDQVKMSLHTIPPTSWTIRKFQPTVIEETKVNGLDAIWTTGPYPLLLRSGEVEITRLIEGHVLIWADETLTYRLETDLPLDEALKIAESLQPIP